MAGQDLQTLYKIRDILRREEYTKSYNRKVNEDHANAASNAISSIQNRRVTVYNAYENKKRKLTDTLYLTRLFIIPAIVYAVAIIALLFVINSSAADNKEYYYMYLCATVSYLSLFVIGSATAEKTNKKNPKFKETLPHSGKVVFTAGAVAALCFVLTIVFANKVGIFAGFFNGVIAWVAYMFWPLANFLCLGSEPSLGLTIFFVVLGACIHWCICAGIDWENKAESNASVVEVKNEYERWNNEWNKAYNAEYDKIAPRFQKLKKPDTYTQEKRALASVLPLEFQTIDMVNKLIWCIEQKYAYDIVSARNWYLKQEQNAAMMQKMQTVINQLDEANRIQKKAAEEAAAAQRAAIAAIEKQTSTINKQMDKLNATARENAEANKKTAYYADKIHHEIKY